MKKGFTMIELIFVIVILGILAAVAIPKLAATRDDAKIAKGATELAMVVNDFGSYYTAQGAFGAISDMTNVNEFSTTDLATDLNGSGAVYFLVEGVACMEINTSAAAALDGNFTVSHQPATGVKASICNGIAAATSKISGGIGGSKTHSFGGSSVKWN
jgi:general secretion pathway protein G